MPSLARAEVSLGAEEQVDGQPSIKSEMMQDPSMAELDESNGDTGSAIHSTDEGDDKDHLEPGLASNATCTFPFLPATPLSCPWPVTVFDRPRAPLTDLNLASYVALELQTSKGTVRYSFALLRYNYC